MKDLVARYIEQGINGSAERDSASRKRSPLPVIFPATGRPIQSLTNAEIDAIFTEEDLQKMRRIED